MSRVIYGKDLLLAAFLFAATLAVFWPVQRFEFLNFDDDVYVTQNHFVSHGLSFESVRWAFTNAESGHFHPLTWLSHALDVSLFGMNAGKHHRTTLWLHALAVGLCFMAWRRLLGLNPETAGLSRWVAFAATAIFAFHPCRVESVAWVATRKDVLSGVFFFAALLAWGGYLARPSRTRLLSTGGFWLLALLAKPTVLPFPLLLLVLDAWPLRRLSAANWKDRVREKGPLFVIMLAFAAIAVWGQRSVGALSGLEAVPLSARLSQASVGVLVYLKMLVFPSGLSIFHPLRPIPVALGIVAGLASVSLLAAAFWVKRVPLAARAGGLWFFLLLLPVLGLVQIGGQSVADRWLYLPTSGLVVGALYAWPPLIRPMALVLPVALIFVTHQTLPTFANSESVFQEALRVDPDNFMAHNNLGNALEARGAMSEAERHYREAVRNNPTWPPALVNLANAEARRGQLGAAVELYQRALALDPGSGLAEYNLALALMYLRRPLEARGHYKQAVRLRPWDDQAALGYGAALVNTGELQQGLEQLRRAILLEPDSAEAHAHYGRALALSGDSAQARAELSQALALDPRQPLALRQLAKLR